MLNTTKPLLTISLAFAIGHAAWAGVPDRISYQGQLTDTLGAPLPADTYELSFSIWDAPTGGNRIWGPQQFTNVMVAASGYFNLVMGPSDDGGQRLSDALMTHTRFLEIQIGTDSPLTPRQEILSAPYAMTAGVSHQLRTRGNSHGGTTDAIAGGTKNHASGGNAFVGAGLLNTNTSSGGVISGGRQNVVSANLASIAGGQENSATGAWSAIGGGYLNSAHGAHATVPGGLLNEAAGHLTFAAGRRAKALHTGSFVWADSQNADFASTANNQFLIRAMNGVGIDGDIFLHRTSPRLISVQEEPDNTSDGKLLRIKAGNASSSGVPFAARYGGNLFLEAGNGYNATRNERGGSVFIRSGANHLTATGDSPNGGDIFFQTGGASNRFTTRMQILELGNVGIGTGQAPTERLQLGDFSSNDHYLALHSAGGGHWIHGIKFRHHNDSFGFTMANDERSSRVGLNILRHEANADGISALFINRATGNVGINQSNPSTTLDVRGSMYVSNGIQTFGDIQGGRLHVRREILGERLLIGNTNINDNSITARIRPIESGQSIPFLISKSNGNDIARFLSGQLAFILQGDAQKPGGGSWQATSDSRLKTDVRPFEYGLEEILRLRPVRFRYRDHAGEGDTSQKEYTGFLAQEVQKVIPEAVTKGEDGYLKLSFDPIQRAQVNAIRELNGSIESVSGDQVRLSEMMREKDAQIAALQEQLTAQQAKLDLWEQRISRLEKRVSGEGAIAAP